MNNPEEGIQKEVLSKPYGSRGQKEKADKGDYIEVTLRFLPNGRPEKELPEVVKEKMEENPNIRVLLLADNHADPRIRWALSYPVALALKELGFTHYGIEASEDIQPLLDELRKGGIDLYNNPKVGPGSYGDRSFADAIYAMAGAGMKVVALDDSRCYREGESISKEERERKLHERLSEILRQEGSKVCVLIGGLHAIPGEISKNSEERVPSLASRLIESGVSIMTVDFNGDENEADKEKIFEEIPIGEKSIGPKGEKLEGIMKFVPKHPAEKPVDPDVKERIQKIMKDIEKELGKKGK